MPIFPPIAILTAIYLRNQLHTMGKYIGIKFGYGLLFIFSVAVFLVFAHFTKTSVLPNPKVARFLLCTAAGILIFSTGLSIAYSSRNLLLSIKLTIIATFVFLLLLISAAPGIDTRSILPLANQLNKLAQPNEEVVTFNRYYQDLPFYLGRRVSILNWRNELSFGMQHQDTSDWMIDDTMFWQRFHQAKRMFVMIDLDEYQKIKQEFPAEKFHLIYATLNTALISNH